MISREHLYSLVLIPVGELMPRLDHASRARLARAITNKLHPTLVEYLQREDEVLLGKPDDHYPSTTHES